MYRFVLVIFLLILIIACRDNPDANLPEIPLHLELTEQILLTLAVEGGSLNHYRSLVDLFEEEYPHIQVRLASLSDVADPNESGIRALATSFDVFSYSPNRQRETQYLLDLRPVRDLDPQFDTADFLPGLLPPATEPLWAIPTGAAYYLIFFDKNAFDAAGLDAPELEWTTDNFLDAALALTVRDGGEVTQWGYVPGQLRYPPLLASQLAAPLGTGDNLRLSDPDVAAAVEWLSDLFILHEVSPWLEEYKPVERRSGSGGQTAQALIGSRVAAMWHTTHMLFDEGRENVGVTAVPYGPHGLAAEPIIYGFAASRGTVHPEAAWQLLHFLSRQPPQEAMFSVEPVPARRSVAAANSYWEQLPDSLASALQYTAENNSPPRITYQAANLLQEAITVHIDDDVPAAVALGQLLPPTAVPPEPETETVVVPTVPAEDDEKSVQINFYTSVTSAEAHRLLANQFHRENPGIHVHILEETIEFNVPQDSLLNRAAASDCFLGSSSDLTDNDLRTAILSIGPLMDLDVTLQAEDFYPAMLNELTVNGELLGIPAGANIPYLEYNRQLFREAEIPEPTLDWTLADFLEITQQLTKGEGESKQYGFVEPYSLSRNGVNRFHVQLLDDSNSIPYFDYTAATEMLIWHADLIRLYEVQPLIRNEQFHTQFEALLREERVAIWAGGFANFLHFMDRSFPDLDIGVAPEPVGPNGHRAPLSVAAYYIFADSSHPKACWEWLKFLAMEPSATYARSQASRLLPGHIETAESEEYATLVGTEMAAIGHAYMNNPPTDPLPPLPSWMSPGYIWLQNAFFAVAAGESDVATALAEAEAKFSQYRQCVIDNDAFEDQAAWNQCANSVR